MFINLERFWEEEVKKALRALESPHPNLETRVREAIKEIGRVCTFDDWVEVTEFSIGHERFEIRFQAGGISSNFRYFGIARWKAGEGEVTIYKS